MVVGLRGAVVIEHRATDVQRVLVVMGTRPEAIKLAPVIRCLRLLPDRFRTIVCTTGQHREMLKQVLRIFEVEPQQSLDVMQHDQSLGQVTTAVLNGLSRVLKEEQPDLVLVQGDTTTAFAGALAAYYQRIPVAHVEAGLRTDDKYSPFPEEINRRLVTHIAEYHFAPTERARENLLREGIPTSNILVTGNTVVDALLYTRLRLASSPSLARCPNVDELGNGKRIVLVTAHRRESFGRPMRQICASIRLLAGRRPDVMFVYPVHMNPNVTGPVHELLEGLPNVRLLPPLDYASFVALMDRATILLTDSGGIQEEGPALGKPVLVMRDVSERPEAIAAGAAELVGTEPRRIIKAVCRLLDDREVYARMCAGPNPYGDGKAAERIATFLAKVNNARDLDERGLQDSHNTSVNSTVRLGRQSDSVGVSQTCD